MMRKLAKLEYVWLDGNEEKRIRSKTRYISIDFGDEDDPMPFDGVMQQIPQWSFDGSSTNQADGSSSDLIIKPIRFFGNPFSARQPNSISYIVLCEVFNPDDSPHESNMRAKLRENLNELEDPNDIWFGVEQEYVFMNSSSVSGWPEEGEPEAQGNYYCGIGGDVITNAHRQVVETHAHFCIQSGINLNGTNAEVMKSQWEYQIGPASAISCADQLWVSRYILDRLAEVRDMSISYDPKPVDGDWNGSGCHINFSNRFMREHGGKDYIDYVCETLKENHDKHIKVYGIGTDKRLTGKHETASIKDFTWEELDRGSSIRIPSATINNDYKGHLEDRRPSANIDPYEAFLAIVESVSSVKQEALAVSE